MNSTAQLSGVNRPLSVELRLINFCACGLDSQRKHDIASSRGVLTKRSDFPRAKGGVRCSPFGGVEHEIRYAMRWEACCQRVTASVCSPRKLQLRTVYKRRSLR